MNFLPRLYLKYSLVFCFTFLLLGGNLFAQGLGLFKSVKFSSEIARSLDTACNSYRVLMPDSAAYQNLFLKKGADLQVRIPTPQGLMVANLQASSILNEGFKMEENANGIITPVQYDAGLYYQGVIAGDNSSHIALSFFKNGQIMGLITSARYHGNIVIGRAELQGVDFFDRPVIVYNDLNLNAKNPFVCHTPDNPLPRISTEPGTNGNLQGLTAVRCKVVPLYLEAGTSLYTLLGSNSTTTTNYITGLMNVSAMLYDAERIAIKIGRIRVNTTADGVGTSTSDIVLAAFSTRMQTDAAFVEPIGHYFTGNQGLGGLAYVDILCSNSSVRTGTSDLYATYSQLPTYSWSVEVVTHELGHNFGSNHTQWCGWTKPNGTLGQIDSCYASESEIGGLCYTGADIPRVGTIMSYCHLNGSIDFSLGFGPLPGAAIRTGLSSASCIPSSNIATPSITASGATTFCAGDSVTLTASGGIRYQWSTGATTSSIVVKSSGSYTVNALQGTCISALSSATVVSAITAPAVAVLSSSNGTTLCTSETTILSSNLVSGNQWMRNGSLITGQTGQTLFVNQAGTYQIRTGPNANNCYSFSEPLIISYNAVSIVHTATASSTTVCPSASVLLRANAARSSYISITDNIQRYISPTGTSTFQVPMTIGTSRTILPTDTIAVTISITHTYVGDLVLTLISPTGGRYTLFSRTGSNGDNLTRTQFSNFLGATIGSSAAPYTGVFTPVTSFSSLSGFNTSGTWNLEVTDAANGDGGTLDSWSFAIKPPNTSYARFQWSVLGGANIDTNTTVTVNPIATTRYQLAKTTFNGCTVKDTVLVNVTNAPAPTISANSALIICSGNSVILTSSATSNNVWSTGATTRSITVSTGGTYTVRQVVSGCTSLNSAAAVVTVVSTSTTPTISIIGSLSFCSGSSVRLTSSAAIGNRWSTGDTSRFITVTSSGSYTVRQIIGSCSSVTSNAAVVTVTQSPVTPTISNSSALNFCSGGSVRLTSSATNNNRWSTGDTTRSILVTSSGNYTVLQVNGSCSSATSTAVVVAVSQTPITPTISNSTPLSFCSGGSVRLTSSTITGNRWNTGDTTRSILVTNSGSYTVLRVLGSCSSAISTATVVAVSQTPTPPTITNSGSLSFCSGGSVTLTSSAATGNRWNNGDTNSSITVTISGTYSVRQIVGSCISSTSIPAVVSVSNLPSTPVISNNGPLSFCSGGSVRLTSSAATGNRWNTGDTTRSIMVTNSGTYSVLQVLGLCSSAISNAAVVAVSQSLTTPFVSNSGSLSFCSGGSVILTSSEAIGNRWNTGDTTRSITVSNSGNYSVFKVSGLCSSSISNTVTVAVNQTPLTPTLSYSSPLNFCSGGSVTLTSSAATGNRWNTGDTTRNITVLNSGNYSVRQIIGSCISGTSITAVVAVNQVPTTPAINFTSPLNFCSGGSVTLTSSAATGNRWNTGDTTQSITVSTSGNYSVLQVVGLCSSSVSNAAVVSVSQTPATPALSYSSPLTFCSGGTVILTSSAATGNRWSNGDTTRSITVTTSGTYSVLQVVGTCSSARSNSAIVSVNQTPEIPTITSINSLTICAGSSITLTSSAAFGNRWNTGDTTQSINVNTAGTYSVFQVRGFCSSAVSNAAVVSVIQTPATPSISYNSPLNFCSGGSVILTSSAATGNRWSNGDTTRSITVTTSGTYSVIQVIGSCSSARSNSAVVSVTQTPAIPTISNINPLSFCSGGSVVLTSSSATGNRWNTGDTTQNITVSTSGSFSLQVVNGSCTSQVSLPVQVQVIPTPETPVITQSGDTLRIANVASYPPNTSFNWFRDNLDYQTTQLTVYSITPTNTSGVFTAKANILSCLSAVSNAITVTSTTNKLAVKAIKLCPNPAKDNIVIEVETPTVFTIYDALGKVVLTEKVENNSLIDIHSLPAGIYSIKAEGFRTTQLVVVR